MERNLNKIILSSILVIIFLMSAGYSVLNKELLISGELIYRAEADIRITNVKLDSVSNAIEGFSPEFSKDEVILGFDMKSDTSTITYKVEVTNFSNVEIGIFKIEGLPDTYEIKDYVLKEKLVDSTNNSKSGMVKEFTIILKANSNFKDKQSIRLKFDFEPIYQITYSGFNNTNGYIKEIIKGENYIQNLGSDVEEVLATMNNVSTKDYVLDNGELEIENVDGNILIENTTPNAPVLNGDMIPVYYDEDEAVWKKADINNENHNWYDYKTQKWANAVTVVEESVKDLSGNNQNGVVHGAKVENGEAYFDGVDDFVDCGYANYDFKDSISINVRFKVHKFADVSQNIIGNQESAGIYLYVVSSKRIVFGIHDGTNYENFGPNYIVELDKWYDVTAIFYQNKMNVYIKDDSGLHVFTKELTNNINIKISSMPFWLGINPSFNSIDLVANITINKVSVYDREISIEEVENNDIKKDSALFEYDFSQMINRTDYVNTKKDAIIPMIVINTMWVWVPRYSYTIKKESGSSDYYGKGSFGNTTPTRLLPGEIDVKFINSSISEKGKAQYTGDMITNWYTNDAFNFDDINNHGLWIGKFETTGRLEKNACIDENCNVSNVTIKPNEPSMRSQRVSSFFYASRSMQHDSLTFGFDKTSGNLHMIKNDEWGAVAYLSQSRYGKYGNNNYTGDNKEIYQNKSSSYITGSSNGTPSKGAAISIQYTYDNLISLGSGKGQAGPGASTTGTIYGIYDMSGGGYDKVMGVIVYPNSTPMSGNTQTSNSGFSGKLADGSDYIGIDFFNGKNKKYYNAYISADINESDFASTKVDKACNGEICYGHALSEINGANSGYNGWYNNSIYFPWKELPWIVRGGDTGSNTGIYRIGRNTGAGDSTVSRFSFIS